MRKLLYILGGITALAAAQPLRPVIIVGNSMSPTFKSGQIVLGTRSFDQINRGDVVVFHKDGSEYVKRVALLPGDTIRQYKLGTEWYTPSKANVARYFDRIHQPNRTLHIKPGELFVVGDNESQSTDSREFGPIKLAEVQSVIPTDQDRRYQSVTCRLGRQVTMNVRAGSSSS